MHWSNLNNDYLTLQVSLQEEYRSGYSEFKFLPTTNFEDSGDIIDYTDITKI